MPYSIRAALKTEVNDIAQIYNSNAKFLIRHLGMEQVDEKFLLNEMQEMQEQNFLSCVIVDDETERIVGIIDYNRDQTVYLSLLMLSSEKQGDGQGSLIYRLFEDMMKEEKKQAIRIDVVNDYAGNVKIIGGTNNEKEGIRINTTRISKDISNRFKRTQ